jgi:co-chaperonin GroES (HSP10)
MSLRATGRNVIVKPDAPPKTSAGGIALPESWAKPQGTGRVISAGGRVEDVKPGDRVSYRFVDGRPFKYQDVELKSLQIEEIAGLVTDE